MPGIVKAYVAIAINLQFAPVERLLEDNPGLLEQLEKHDRIALEDAVQLVHKLYLHSQEVNMAAIMGRHLGVASHGPVGYATLSAPTVGKALTTFVEWFRIRCDTYAARISEREDAYEITISDTSGDRAFETFFAEAFLRAFEVLIATLMAEAPKHQTTLYFASEAINRRAQMCAEYDSRLVFAANENKMSVPKDIWFFRSPLYDRDAYEFNLGKCRQLLAAQAEQGRIDMQVRLRLQNHFERVMLDQSMSAPPSQKALCEAMNITERTMIRRLKRCHQSYRNILEEERQRHAERMLRDARYSIAQIADALGYREAANFCRAFKKWTGQRPSDYRRAPDVDAGI
ncbi:MAG: hypothetical protein C9356_11035 [Oleiphilus sp.]|nr:MAG: hypothetical protein C9356_11035 [Oleiphilus sp.]